MELPASRRFVPIMVLLWQSKTLAVTSTARTKTVATNAADVIRLTARNDRSRDLSPGNS